MCFRTILRRSIDIGKERGGIYYLEGARELQSKSNSVIQVARETFDREKILLWHYQLAYPFFSYLERLFP